MLQLYVVASTVLPTLQVSTYYLRFYRNFVYNINNPAEAPAHTKTLRRPQGTRIAIRVLEGGAHDTAVGTLYIRFVRVCPAYVIYSYRLVHTIACACTDSLGVGLSRSYTAVYRYSWRAVL